jgi:hypothetical protein
MDAHTARQSGKFALHWVPLATALNGCRQTGSSTLHAHNVGTYRPYESNYLGASNISVMDCTAVLTAPFTHIERKPRAYMPAIRAYTRRALPGIELKHLAAMPARLVSDLAGKLAHSRIGYRTRKFVVSKHPLHVVRLYRQRLVLANQLTTRFVQEILACVGDAGVQASHPKPLPSISIGSFSLSGQPSLRPLEVLFPLLYVVRVAGFVASRGHDHILDTEVDADKVGLGSQGLDFDLAGEADKVAATGVAPDRHHLGYAFNLTAPAQLERPELGQHQPMVAGRERPVHLSLVKLIAHRLRRVLLFKLGILGAALKEVLKGMVLVTQHLGQNGAVGPTEPGALAPLERRNLAGNINARQALTVPLVRLGTALKGMIPDMPCTAEVLRKLLLLRGIWIKAEFISLANHGASLAASLWDCGDSVPSSGSPSLCANFTAKQLIEWPWRSRSSHDIGRDAYTAGKKRPFRNSLGGH